MATADMITVILFVLIIVVLNWLGGKTQDATFPLIAGLAAFFYGGYIVDSGLTIYQNWVINGVGSNYLQFDAFPVVVAMAFLGVGSIVFAYHLASK